MARFEVITGPERRRRWSAAQKRAIVAESLAPGAVVTAIARRAEICPGQIYRWRREIGVGNGFAQVLIAPVGDGDGCPASPAIEMEFAEKAEKPRGSHEGSTRSREAIGGCRTVRDVVEA